MLETLFYNDFALKKNRGELRGFITYRHPRIGLHQYSISLKMRSFKSQQKLPVILIAPTWIVLIKNEFFNRLGHSAITLQHVCLPTEYTKSKLRHFSRARALPTCYGEFVHSRDRATVGAEPCTAASCGTGARQICGAAFYLCASEA